MSIQTDEFAAGPPIAGRASLDARIVSAVPGSAMGAELGTMRVTEQIDALEVMATDPVHYLVVPRVWAATLMLPLLIVFANAVGIAGGYVVSVILFGANPVTYLDNTFQYMDLEAGTPMREIKVDTVFVGSCTNGRIEDLRLAAEIIKGRQVDKDTRLLVVPGSVRVRLQAQDEGLDVIFKEAGAEWRGAGCSMCLGMNPDTLQPGERSASTSNRNFEGRQGKGGRTHLVSVPVAAATAIRGTLSSPADLEPVGTGSQEA